MENKRRKDHKELEVVQPGFANGVAEGFPLQQSEKDKMIDEAEVAYGKFLDALKSFSLLIIFKFDVLHY